MEYQAPEQERPSCFKSAAARKFFLNECVAAFEAAEGHSELVIIYEELAGRFHEMEKGHEYDIMALDIINARYKGCHERLEEQRDWVWRQVAEWVEKTQYEGIW